jgi:hypothetical protein
MLRASSRVHAVLNFVARTLLVWLCPKLALGRLRAATSGIGAFSRAHAVLGFSLLALSRRSAQCRGKKQAAPPGPCCGCSSLHINI